MKEQMALALHQLGQRIPESQAKKTGPLNCANWLTTREASGREFPSLSNNASPCLTVKTRSL